MSSSAAKKSIKSILIAFSSQIIIMGLGFILPRMLIKGFGSEVNGFFSTSTQLYSYLEILRAGVGMAAIQALYKPITENNVDDVSRIISTSKVYFKKAGYIYLSLSGLITVGFVIAGNNSLNGFEIILIVAMQGISGWISFSHINWFIDLLRAEGKNYIFVSIQTVGTICIKFAEIALIYFTHNPVLVKSASLVVILMELFIFNSYRKKYYSHYDFDKPGDVSLLRNRRSYLIFHISSLICTNTDVVILSMFCGYETSSVYAVYYMVIAGVNALINTVYSSTAFLLGHAYQSGIEYFKKVHDMYYLVYTTLTTALFSICYILLLPFIKLYTAGIQDVNYIYKYLPLLFCLIQIITCGKNVGDMTVNVGGLAKNVVWRSILEATINIVVSIALVQFIGIYGVLIGTITATFYRLMDVIIFTNKKVLKRKPFKTIKVFLVNVMFFIGVVLLNDNINVKINSYLDFIGYALIISPVIIIICFGMMLLLNPSEGKLIINTLNKKINNRRK